VDLRVAQLISKFQLARMASDTLDELLRHLVTPAEGSEPLWNCLDSWDLDKEMANLTSAKLVTVPKAKPAKTDKRISLINTKGKRKSDHELREEFYRNEFRTQTGGKAPPAFGPTRSAYDESFVWRPQVNALYGINIPVYRKINGKLDGETTATKSKKRSIINLHPSQLRNNTHLLNNLSLLTSVKINIL